MATAWHCSFCRKKNNSLPVGKERDCDVLVCAHCGQRSYVPPPVSPEAFQKYQELKAATGLQEFLMLN